MNNRTASFLILAALGAAAVWLVLSRDTENQPPPRRQRLFELDASLDAIGESFDEQAVPLPPFSLEEVWHVTGSLREPLNRDLFALVTKVSESTEVAGPELRLTGRRGGVYTLVPLEPGAVYRFSGRARGVSLKSDGTAEFYGGTWYLAELDRFGNPEDVLQGGLRPVLQARHQFPMSSSWQQHEVTFRAGVQSRALLIAAVLGMPGEVESGFAEFSEPSLSKLSEEAYRAGEILDQNALLMRTEEPSDWRYRRRIRFELGAETRPSVALLPGEELAWDVSIPATRPLLEFALAPWLGGAEVRVPQNETRVRVSIDATTVLSETLPSDARRLDLRWEERLVGLDAWAGQQVRLTFEVTGDRPAVVGAPTVRMVSRGTEALNVLLISIDTLRADHVSAYGYGRETTPNLDRLASQGIRFADVTAQAPYTLPSHVSMLSGQFPSVHGVQSAERLIAPRRTPLLAEILSEAGYTTRAFTAGGYLNASFGFDRGFDAYSNVDPIRHARSPHFETFIARRPDLLTAELVGEYGPKRVSDWIRANQFEPFFLFVHSYEVHDFDPPPGALDQYWRGKPPVEDFSPYLNHEHALQQGIEPELLEYIIAHYDAALHHTDEVIGEWLALLDELGLADRTVVAITSDHGEELGERGVIAHTYTLYEEMIRVPMILRVPGRAPRVITEPVMVIDLVPTLLGRLGLPNDVRMQGRDLLGGDEHAFIWSEVDEIAHKYSLRDSRSGWKVIRGPEPGGTIFPNLQPWEVFNLKSDPEERSDLAGSDPEGASQLRKNLPKLREAFSELGASFGKLGQGGLDEKTSAQLRQLGYLKDR